MKLHPRLTAEGVLLARRAERFRPVAGRDGRGWVIGYGHRASAREGAAVSEADATALLAYDLSQSAGRVEPLLRKPVSPALFDALNAFAFRVGPEAFARSDRLRRVNAGEPVSPAEAAVDEPGPSPPSAVAAAAQAVRDRLAQVLVDPEPVPPRAPREPWPEPVVAPPIAAASPSSIDPEPSPSDLTDGVAEEARPSEPVEAAAFPDGDQGDPPPPPFVAPPRAVEAAAEVSDDEPTVGAALPPSEPARLPPPHAVADVSRAPVAFPAAGFARGGRPRLWDRVRANPYVYMAVGACGLALFGCALLGFLLGRPTGPGLALGVVGVICLSPALAFFLHRRSGGEAGG